MAEQFYDVNQPVRRRLHEGFIRQNLDNFTNQPNVIQFTSAEFTGPLAFEQFWLDTVGNWERETRRHPLIALAAPKNVQDAILADAARAAVVDVICFRYWWQTEQGTFAPPGGENLSPRQSERKWHGGTAGDHDLAQMVTEYRGKFPAKVIIAAGEDAGLLGSWAFLCAGGSMPDLPQTTDAKLLCAIPAMRSWLADAPEGVWALHQAGAQMLIYNGNDDPAGIDLSAESGTFRARAVDTETGRVAAQFKILQAGGKVILPGGLFWLTRD